MILVVLKQKKKNMPKHMAINGKLMLMIYDQQWVSVLAVLQGRLSDVVLFCYSSSQSFTAVPAECWGSLDGKHLWQTKRGEFNCVALSTTLWISRLLQFTFQYLFYRATCCEVNLLLDLSSTSYITNAKMFRCTSLKWQSLVTGESYWYGTLFNLMTMSSASAWWIGIISRSADHF